MALLALWCTVLFRVFPAPPGDVADWKLGTIFRTIKYSKWSSKVLPATSPSFVIGLVGSDPFDGHLPDVIGNTKFADRPVVVRTVTNSADARGCQVLFVPEGKLSLWQDWTKGNGPGTGVLKGVLTIGEDDAFLSSGGIIQLVAGERKGVFEPANLRASGLDIDPRYLKYLVKDGRTAASP